MSLDEDPSGTQRASKPSVSSRRASTRTREAGISSNAKGPGP